MSQRRGTRDQLATVKFFRHETKIVLEILGEFTWLLSFWLQHFGCNILTSKRQVRNKVFWLWFYLVVTVLDRVAEMVSQINCSVGTTINFGNKFGGLILKNLSVIFRPSDSKEFNTFWSS